MLNGLTIDVEDYYMVSAFADYVKFSNWHLYESRVENNTKRVLELLSEHNVKATFFVLGWVAEKYPHIVKELHAAGHEIACHSYNHRIVYKMTPEEFREDTRKAKNILEEITGTEVIGYRAPSYSVVKESLWALDILIEEGFSYDASIFPIHHDRYGLPGAPRFPHVIKCGAGRIIEMPPSTYSLFGQNVPVAGGGYLRLFPISVTKSAIRQINKRERENAIVYFHPWEIDADQPRMKGAVLSKIRHYLNLSSMMPKLRALLSEFEFQPLSILACKRYGIAKCSGVERCPDDILIQV